MRRSMTLVAAFAVVVALFAGCIPRHPPHTPQPVGEERNAPADR